MNKIMISPAYRGKCTPIDLLQSEGSMIFRALLSDLEKGGRLFEITGDNFIFIFGAEKDGLVVRRNEVISKLTFDDLPKDSSKLFIGLTWSYDNLTLYCGLISSNGKELKNASVKTIPCIPPSSLVKWAREQNLLSITNFDDEYKFREKIYSCLDSIQQKIDETGAVTAFWDIHYKDKRIESRTPKNEPDAHSVIHSLLYDQMLLAGIEVIPEYKTGVGNLDFMFLGNIKNNGNCKLCVEFKNAHSDDIFHGLESQLPSYMKNKNSRYGAYCVLYYKGEWFQEPSKFNDEKDLLIELYKAQMKSSSPIVQDGIRVFIYDLTKKKTASKKIALLTLKVRNSILINLYNQATHSNA